ncbi:hypothetical protein AB6F95_004642 [Salmonella enterica]
MTVQIKAAVIKPATFSITIDNQPVKKEVVEIKAPTQQISDAVYKPDYCQIAVDVITAFCDRGGCVAPLTAVAARVGVPVRVIIQWTQEHNEFFDAIYDTAANIDFEVLQNIRDEQYKLAMGYVLPETKVFYNKSLDKTIEHTIDKYYVPDLKAIMDLNYQLDEEYRRLIDRKEKAGAVQMPISVSFGVNDCSIEGHEDSIKKMMGIEK